MKKQIQLLLNEFNIFFERSPWFGDSVIQKLATVDYKLVNQELLSTNSIAMLVNHMIQWRIFGIEKLRGNSAFDIQLNSEMDWPKISVSTHNEWVNLLNKLKNTQTELIQLIGDKDDTYLNEICAGKDYTNHFLLTGIIHHDVYHLGQIGLMNSSLQKSIDN